MEQFFDCFLNLDTHLVNWVIAYGPWIYLLLFIIIFCETGLIITPFLPGDSLLFTVGSLAAQDNQPLNISYLLLLLTIASFSGNQINYFLGRCLGLRLFKVSNSKFFNKKYLEKAEFFYKKNGGKTIILARFLPIIRTFAPFVAGMSQMPIKNFLFYNILSAVLWIISLIGFGYFFGSLPLIKDNFSLVIYSIMIVTLLPSFFAFFYEKIKLT